MAIRLLVAVAIAVGIFFLQNGLLERSEELRKRSPFYQVTNREMGIFLWSFPEYMRRNVRDKSGYLPAFRYIDGVTVERELADQIVQAPPELLMRYHEWRERGWDVVWRRERENFERFLSENQEWQGKEESDELQRAFVGWRNFTLEGEAIERVGEEGLETFFADYPQFREAKPPFLKVAFYNYLRQKSSLAIAKPGS